MKAAASPAAGWDDQSARTLRQPAAGGMGLGRGAGPGRWTDARGGDLSKQRSDDTPAGWCGTDSS